MKNTKVGWVVEEAASVLNAGIKYPIARGVPHREERCPKCGKSMLPKGSYHHRKLKEQRSGQ